MLRIFLVALLLSGCGGARKNSTASTYGANYARDFALTDHTGVKRTLADYRGKVVAVFFGFTQCPTLPDHAQRPCAARKRLGKDGEQYR
jgi:protein SCO1/2